MKALNKYRRLYKKNIISSWMWCHGNK
jgi:hypothetical protein